ncbi:MAG TPA: hypothetical protein VGK32_03855 [Vicinamibacterales bacterium]|jgi:hypothetical protein
MSTTYDSVFLSSPFDRPSWTAAPEYREGAIKSFGFTERQTRFLVAVMLHGGACAGRCWVGGLLRRPGRSRPPISSVVGSAPATSLVAGILRTSGKIDF